MAELKNLIVNGAARVNGDIYGNLKGNADTATNADKLDGKDSTAFANASHTHTKSDIGLGNVENKSSATIRGEITAENIPSLSASKITSGTFADARIASAANWNGKQDKLTAGTNITISGTTISAKDTTYSAATTSASGLMSSSDKTKLDGIASGATKVIESTVSGWGFTKNTGTVTSVAVKMNGSAKGTVTTSGTIDLGTVITSHQDISGKADKVSITSGTAGTSSATSGSSLEVPYVTMNEQGIVTGYGTHTHTVTGFYSKPSGGIPKSDMSFEVYDALNRAENAVQQGGLKSINNQTLIGFGNITIDPGINEAPEDDHAYMRCNGRWLQTAIPRQEPITMEITSSGTYQWPAGYNYCDAFLVNGGNSGANTYSGNGSGGAGGHTSKVAFTKQISSNEITISIGNGGPEGTGNINLGGTTSVVYNNVTYNPSPQNANEYTPRLQNGIDGVLNPLDSWNTKLFSAWGGGANDNNGVTTYTGGKTGGGNGANTNIENGSPASFYGSGGGGGYFICSGGAGYQGYVYLKFT